MILGISGHRPAKIGGFSIPNPIYSYIKNEAKRILSDLNPSVVISGAALGFDQLIMELCIDLNIDFIAAVPFKGQEAWWPIESREKYFHLLSHAKQVEVVCHGGFAAWKMQVRNQWIVDNSDRMLTCFDGSNGGTKNTVEYSISKNKELIYINPLNIYKPA